MLIESGAILPALAVGLGATLMLDLWAQLLEKVLRIPATNWCVVGRWFCYMPGGVFTHSNIAKTPRKNFECTTGWLAHYVIGGIYGLLLILIVSDTWLAQPTLVPAIAFGIITAVFPLFVMQPSFGVGIASSKVPNPTGARIKTLVSHAVFGAGMYLTAIFVGMAV